MLATNSLTLVLPRACRMPSAARCCLNTALARFLVLGLLGSARAQESNDAPKLEITALDGEGAINHDKRCKARDPVVRVADDNDRPIAGVVATLVMQNQGANGLFANGTRSLSILTTPRGVATTTGLSLNTVAGNMTIQVTAPYQGQTVSAEITQKNRGAASTAKVCTDLKSQGQVTAPIASQGKRRIELRPNTEIDVEDKNLLLNLGAMSLSNLPKHFTHHTITTKQPMHKKHWFETRDNSELQYITAHKGGLLFALYGAVPFVPPECFIAKRPTAAPEELSDQMSEEVSRFGWETGSHCKPPALLLLGGAATAAVTASVLGLELGEDESGPVIDRSQSQ
jgi:hypothetical protein